MDIRELRRLCSELFLFLLIVCFFKLTTPQIIVENEALSSPSSITAMKSSAIWLHWNYTFAYSPHITFLRQHWTVNETDINRVTVVAKKIGQNGQMTIESILPSTMMGRIIAFPNNNTLCIKNLHYNDSLWQVKSTGFIKLDGSPIDIPNPLKPRVINLNVQGVPEYRMFPPEKLDVDEDGVLSIVTHFDGNPKPIAEVQWSDSSSKQGMTVSEEHPFIYKAEYSASPISSQFCGKTLILGVQNSVGKAVNVNIAVAVILTLSNPNLRAGKPNQFCVEVQWQKKESGLCNVTYTVNFKDQSGSVQYTNSEINNSGTTRCGIPSNVNITKVELQMSSTKKIATFTTDVSEKPIPPPTSAPTTKGTGTISSQPTTRATTATTARTRNPLIPKTSKVEEQVCSNTAIHIGYNVVIIILTSVIVFFLAEKFRRKKRKSDVIGNKGVVGNPRPTSNSQIEMHYMELDHHQKANESNYATLSISPYETPKDHTYANVAKF